MELENNIDIGKAIGEFNEKGERTGLWQYYFYNGTISAEKNYLNGLYHGCHKSYRHHPKKKIAIISSVSHWIHGKRNGLNERYSPSGKLKFRCKMVNNNIDGLCEYFFYNGKYKMIGQLNNDRRFKLWKSFSFKTGKIKELVFYI